MHKKLQLVNLDLWWKSDKDRKGERKLKLMERNNNLNIHAAVKEYSHTKTKQVIA